MKPSQRKLALSPNGDDLECVDLTSHLSTPREPILKKISELATTQHPLEFSIASTKKKKKKKVDVAHHLFTITKRQNKRGNTHCNPTKLNVKSAILVDSFRPLMEGVPAHLAACGILIIHVLACTQLSSHEPKPESERAGGLASNRSKLKTPVRKRRAIQIRITECMV
jgi:hypothetical protein